MQCFQRKRGPQRFKSKKDYFLYSGLLGLEEISFEEMEKGNVENPFVAKFQAFFETQCMKHIEKLVSEYPQKKSLMVDFKELEHYDFQLADELLVNPDVLIEAAEMAVHNIEIPMLELEEFKPHVRFFNLPKDRTPLLRNIGSEHIGKFISVEGIVRMMTDVLPKLKLASWQCRRCGNVYKIEQEAFIMKQPVLCECKHKDFQLMEEQSTFVDYQKIEIQEPLEQIKGSEQATNLKIYVMDDLVNKVAPGDHTKFCGILRLIKPKEQGAVFERYLEGVHLEETAKDFEEVDISKEEEEEIKRMAKDPKIYDLLTASIAPNIYGHEIMKEAIVMQLFGGVKKALPNGTSIRGNIHVFLVGDPGTGKSQTLQAVNKIAPKAIYIAGKTSTGAGISATAVKDDFGEGGWTLKAGALVLASGGMCMIDEMDKMEAEDRSALHESMEQGMISVAKAGIVTRFKTDTTILAAANPKFSRFDPYSNFLEQIDLPSSLISRFDLFFMIRDVLDRKKDEETASHILRTHQSGEILMQAKHKGKTISKQMEEEIKELINPPISGEVLKKYISYARQNVFPTLTKEAIQTTSDYYVNLRDQGKRENTYSATPRQLEGLIRLSEASARVRLSDVVEVQDTERAIRLVRTSLQELVTDKETGKIDIDLITTGQSQSQSNKMKKIMHIISSKAKELDKVPVQEIIEEMAVENVNAEEVRDIISKLKKKGDIYEPGHGFVLPTQKG